MRAGRLKHRITIQEKTASKDGYGEEVTQWIDVAPVWASVEPLRGSEFIESRGGEADLDARIVIRFREGIREDMRVLYRAQVFDIKAVIHPFENRRELHLMCREVRAKNG